MQANTNNPFQLILIQGENEELRADVKFLMNQNSDLIDKMGRQSTNNNFERPAETSVTTTNGFIQEVSYLIESVNQLTSHNFELLKGELLKIARVSGNDIGKGS